MALQFDEEGKVIIPKGITNEKKFYTNKEISATIRGEPGFIFDKGDYEKFLEEFDFNGEAYISQNTYLIRNNKNHTESFHRWLMKDEIEEFCKENNCDSHDVEVHHINFNHKDNRKHNLVCLTKIGHKLLHEEEENWMACRKANGHRWAQRQKSENEMRKIHWYNFMRSNRALGLSRFHKQLERFSNQ